jgi:hypothetical protein
MSNGGAGKRAYTFNILKIPLYIEKQKKLNFNKIKKRYLFVNLKFYTEK